MSERSRVTWSDVSRQNLGRVTLAGYLYKSVGIGWDRMRILGSYALVYLHRGAGLYQDALGTEQVLRSGDLIVVYPDLPHRYGPRPDSDDSWNEFYVVFDGPIFDLWRREQALSAKVVHLEPPAYWLPRLAGSVESKTPMEAMLAVQEFLMQMTQETRNNAADTDWLRRAKGLLDGFTRADEVNVAAAAEAMGETYETFRKRFQKLGGISPGRYASERVMARACGLLRCHRETCAKIASACGYCDEFHFSRRFKQIVGLTPSGYRRQFQRL